MWCKAVAKGLVILDFLNHYQTIIFCTMPRLSLLLMTHSFLQRYIKTCALFWITITRYKLSFQATVDYSQRHHFSGGLNRLFCLNYLWAWSWSADSQGGLYWACVGLLFISADICAEFYYKLKMMWPYQYEKKCAKGHILCYELLLLCQPSMDRFITTNLLRQSPEDQQIWDATFCIWFRAHMTNQA